MSQRTRAGFTLIELLIVIVIVGILVAIAIPRFAARRTTERAAPLRTSLERVVTAQEAYFAQHQRYASDLAALGLRPEGTAQIVIGGAGVADGSGWSATATEPGSDVRCYVGVGRDTVVGGQTLPPAVVTCR